MARLAPEPIQILRGHSKSVTSLCSWQDSLLISGDESGLMKLWNLKTTREYNNNSIEIDSILHHTNSIQSINSFLHVSSQICSSGRDGYVRMWDLSHFDFTEICSIPTGCLHFCNSCTIKNTSDATYLICCPSYVESRIIMWDIRNPTRPAMMFDPLETMTTGMTMCLLYRATNTNSAHQVICGYENGSLLAFDVRSPRYLSCTAVSNQPIMSIDSSMKNDSIAVATADETIHQVSLVQDEEQDIYSFKQMNSITTALSKGGSSIQYRFDGRILVSGRWDHTVRIYDTYKLKPIAILRYHRDIVNAVEFLVTNSTSTNSTNNRSTNGIFATASKDGKIALWDCFADSIRVT